MTVDDREIDAHVRSVLHVPDSAADRDRALEKTLVRIEQAAQSDDARRSMPTPRRRWRIATLAVALVVVTGSAVAAPRVVGVFDANKPAAEQVGELNNEGTPSPASDTVVVDQAVARIRSNPGGDDLGRLVEDNAKVLLSERFDGTGLDIVAVPTDRGLVCYAFSRPDGGGSSTCNPHFTEQMPITVSGVTGAVPQVYGLAADGVVSVELETSDGVQSVPVARNAYLWHGSENTAIQSVKAITDDGDVVEIPARF